MAIATITLHETGQKISAELKNINPNKFLIHFRRPENYDGEFGFDWMRKNYKEICNNYETLKKEYYDAETNKKVIIDGQEYFVPWLSMFPNQEGVKLKLEVEKIDGYKIKKSDYIEIKSKEGIVFTPNKLKVAEIDNNTTIKVTCEKPLLNDITVEIKNNNDKTVGYLNIAKTKKIINLPINIVLVSDSNHIEKLKDYYRYIFSNLEETFQKKSFNQSFIKPFLINNLDNAPFISLDNFSKDDYFENNLSEKGRKKIIQIYEEKK